MEDIKIISGQNQELTDKQRQKMLKKAQKAYGDFLTSLGYDWQNDSNMKDTPKRVAKMYVNETTKGSYDSEPTITVFPNTKKYTGLVFDGNISVKSLCSHHMMPFFGKAYVAYIPGENMAGLSKLNRIVDFFCRRPQLQEQLTQQIHDYINKKVPDNKGVAVYIEATHTCVSMRGVNDNSVMKTSVLTGAFFDETSARSEFYTMIGK